MRLIAKPVAGECAAYVLEQYVRLVPDDARVLEHLRDNVLRTVDVVRALPPERLAYRYAPGKWTVKDILAHLIDDERIYAYRALRFARGDRTALPGFAQDDYARAADADARTLDALVTEFTVVRAGTVALFDSFPDAVLRRSGVADGQAMSVRAIAYHIAGHELRHRHVVQARYT